MKDQVYDILYIGTGPINVIDAVHQTEQGEKVLMVDSAPQIGGAWVAINVGDYGMLEIGCHIWSYNKKAYAFIQRYFDFEAIHLNPTPAIVSGKTKISYDYKNALTTLKKSAGMGARFKFKSLVKYWKENPAARFPVLPKKYLYPKGGARDFQQSLEKKITDSAVSCELNTRIDMLTLTAGIWTVTSANGTKFNAKKVIMTSTSGVERVINDKEEITLERSTIHYTHFHLVIQGSLKKDVSYLRIMGHSLIHRISDITYQLAEEQSEEVTVLLVGVFNEDMTGKDDAGDLTEIMTYLRTNNYLNDQQEIIYSQKNAVATEYLSANSLKMVQDVSDSLEVLHTTDLIYGIHYALPRWNK